jgi:hypothetical protein
MKHNYHIHQRIKCVKKNGIDTQGFLIICRTCGKVKLVDSNIEL